MDKWDKLIKNKMAGIQTAQFWYYTGIEKIVLSWYSDKNYSSTKLQRTETCHCFTSVCINIQLTAALQLGSKLHKSLSCFGPEYYLAYI